MELSPVISPTWHPKSIRKLRGNLFTRRGYSGGDLPETLGALCFFEAASFSQGSILNFSEIAEELAINRLVIVYYFEIFGKYSSIGNKNRPFYKSSESQIVAHQKFYFFRTRRGQSFKTDGATRIPEHGSP